MSKVLMIRHLPAALSFQDKEQLLKHFGAEKVWETYSKRNYIFASFSNVEHAKESLIRLHQLEIGNRRLVVEYSFEKVPVTESKLDSKENSISANNVKSFLKLLNAWNPSLNFYQPPPVHIKYKYPDINPYIVINIINNLFSHKPFYTQVLHLMNKMCINAPFNENESSLQFFKETFREFFLDEMTLIPQPVSETESELSCPEDELKEQVKPIAIKRKKILPQTRKRVANLLSSATLPKAKKKMVTQNDVFETVVPLQEPKKISLVVHQDTLQRTPEECQVVGELGKFQKEEHPQPIEEPQVETEKPTITKRELLKNRISYRDMKVLPIFKNYHPGQPSMRLYIKNLAKSVTDQDIKRIYRRYVENLSEEEQIGFDVRVMQEGRMKGQAFVTFPSVEIAENALRETNGYMLNDKPMVVQFARVANKKTIH